MNNIKQIRHELGLSQSAFGRAIGVTQGNIHFYEKGMQDVPPKVARRVIEVARVKGLDIDFNHIYAIVPGGEGAG